MVGAVSFVSATFLVFFAGVWLACQRLGHRGQNRLLLVASYVFYGWWDWRFLSLLLLSSLVDYGCGRGLGQTQDARRRRLLVTVSVGANLGVLGAFKYLGFFVESARAAMGALGVPFDAPSLSIVLPVGISFYTFQSLSYTIDLYRGRLAPVRRLDDFLLYVSFFPQLVAGPIERAERLLPQIERPRELRPGDVSSGALLALFGFAKKMVVADNLAPFVESVYRQDTPSGAALWLATYAFALQIYADFSGYTDIARGTARMLGFDLCRNFRTPYFATNPSDFWLRWHISLSSWLRDYLYIPLGGNRTGRTARNLALTMLLGGLWHGAAWHFVAWGAWHGALLAVFHRFQSRSAARSVSQGVRSGWRFWLKAFGFFQLTCVGWLLFRVDDLGVLWSWLPALALPTGWLELAPAALALVAAVGLPLLAIDVVRYRRDDPEPWLSWPTPGRAAFTLVCFYFAVLLGTPHAPQFIYFQF